jgi:hypothetical protein
MDRRTSLKWVMAASAAWPWLSARGAPGAAAAAHPGAAGYGTDPNLVAVHHVGEFWPLTFTPDQRKLAATLSDLIIPADAHSVAASAVGVVDFIDEWVSAPYPAQRHDRSIVLEGFRWLDAESQRRFGKSFVEAQAAQRTAICDDICDATRASAARASAARFFALYRDLTAGAFYSTPIGRKDLGYVGNVPLTHFDPPPAELLKKLNL